MAAVSASVDLAGFMLPYIITYILAEGQHTSLVSTRCFTSHSSAVAAKTD